MPAIPIPIRGGNFFIFLLKTLDKYTQCVYDIYRKEVNCMSRKRKHRKIDSEKLKIAALILGIAREIIALVRELIE